MRPTLRRIAIHGGLTAIVLGIVGMMLAELASMWMSATMAKRSPANGAVADTSVIQTRLPLAMAGLGFSVVAIGELILSYLRKNQTPPPAPVPPPLDATEKLLEELLAQAEAKASKQQETVVPSGTSLEGTASPTPLSRPTGGES